MMFGVSKIELKKSSVNTEDFFFSQLSLLLVKPKEDIVIN